MKNFILTIGCVLLSTALVYAQDMPIRKENFVQAQASMEIRKLDQKEALQVIMDPAVKLFDQPTFVKLKDIKFSDGTIEVKVLSRFLPNAPEWARGFIGVVFRVHDDNRNFEGIYIRPSNGRSEDQVRRNHSTQYFSFPGFDFDHLRKIAPEQYESYADMEMNTWIQMKIVVKGNKALLFLNGGTQPVLLINDLKHGADNSGSVGFWVGPGTEGYFSDLKISK